MSAQVLSPVPEDVVAPSKVTVDLNIGQILKDLVGKYCPQDRSDFFFLLTRYLKELDLKEARNMNDLTEGTDITTDQLVFLDDASTKKFIEFVNKIQAGINYQADVVQLAQEQALRFLNGILKPEDYKVLDDPVEMAEYAKTNLEDIDIVMNYAVERLKSVEKVREGLPRLKDNLDPMQVVTKVAPEQFQNLVASIAPLIEEIEVLKTGLTAIKERLNACKAKLSKGLIPADENKPVETPPPSVETKLAEEIEKSGSPDSLAPALSAVAIDDKAELEDTPVEAMELVEAEPAVGRANL